MGTTTDKLNKLMETKAAIKAALVEKGQNPSDVFSTYADNIKAIKADLNGTASPGDVLKGETFYNTDQNKKLTGTIETFTPQNEYTSNQTLETSGKYLSGNIIINTPTKKDEQTKTVELNMSTGNQVITPDPNKVLTEVTINKPNTFIESNIKADISIGGIIGTFTSDADAVASDIAEGKTAYVNGVKITGTNTNEVNYSTLLTSTYPNRYSITTNLTGVTASANNPETIEDGSEALLTFTASDGYNLPNGVNLTNVTSYNWNKSTGALEISRPTGDVTIEIVGEEIPSGFTVSVNNLKYRSDSIAAKIYDGQNNTGTLVATINAGDTVNVNISSGYLFAEYNTEINMYYSQGTTSGGVTFENYNFGNPASLLYKVTGNGSITGMYMYMCFVEGTLITLADGSQKKVEDINYNDKVLTYDFDKGEFTQGDIFWIAKENVATEYWKITLSDGTELKLVGSNGKSHRLFSVDNSKFLYPQDFTGKVFKENKETPTIVSCKKVNEEVKYYNFLNTHLNCFANGTMAGCRFSNIYPIENMKYVKNEIRNNSLESFKDIPQKYIDGLRLKEQPLEKDESNVNYYDTVKEHIMNIYMRLERKE